MTSIAISEASHEAGASLLMILQGFIVLLGFVLIAFLSAWRILFVFPDGHIWPRWAIPHL